MILIRGVSEEKYAKQIDSGVVGFGDLLSVLLKPAETGYAKSNYEENYIRKVFGRDYFINRKDNNDIIEKTRIFNSVLTLNPLLGNIFISSFHIVNPNSIEWVEKNFNDNSHFMFLIPKLIKTETEENLVFENILGRRMQYVNNYHDFEFGDFNLSTLGITNTINRDLAFSSLNGFDAIASFGEFMILTYKACFTRVVDDTFNESENEFRIIFKYDNFISEKGVILSNGDRDYNLIVDDVPYIGRQFRYDMDNVLKPDILMYPKQIPMNMNPTTYINEFARGHIINVNRSFIDVDITPFSKKYGYIGDKKTCIKFLEKCISGKMKETKIKKYLK